MPSALQLVLSKYYLSESNISKTGDDVTHIINLLNDSINADVQDINVLGFL